jgi:hypothetical protein
MWKNDGINNVNIVENVKKVKEEIEKIKRLEEVTIVGAVKRIDINKVKEGIKAGITNLGENYWQEAREKINLLKDENVNWHFIGKLQRNKVKKVVSNFSLIQTLDSFSLAQEINKVALSKGLVQDCLIEIKFTEEERRAGIFFKQTYDFIERIKKLNNICIKGLMVMAPLWEDNKKGKVFAKTHQIFTEIRKKNISNFNFQYLSMGMSDDYKIALKEGSNMLRLGRIIFGQRR